MRLFNNFFCYSLKLYFKVPRADSTSLICYKALQIKDYLLASSMATATATCHKNNLRLFHHGVVTCAEHIVCVFPENIISRFDVSVNDEAEEFAEMLRFGCFHSRP